MGSEQGSEIWNPYQPHPHRYKILWILQLVNNSLEITGEGVPLPIIEDIVK